MSNDKLYKRIVSCGIQGIRSTKLRSEFGAKSRKAIEELLSQGLIFGEKKGGAAYYWSKDNFMQHLINSDPKFKLIYDMYSNANNTISKSISHISKELDCKVSNIVSTSTQDNGNNGSNLSLDQFKMEFDRTIAEIPTAIGWVELSMIRERICDKYNLSKQNFYTFASQLFDQFNNRYELSSGGNEGVMLRGLVHGFVRCL
ncbi:MAG: hypothetical protein ACE5J2_05220 [Nitrososphaerales archaeon]